MYMIQYTKRMKHENKNISTASAESGLKNCICVEVVDTIQSSGCC